MFGVLPSGILRSTLPCMAPMGVHERIRQFLDGSPFAVVGVSRDRAKYGNKVLRCYLQNGRRAIPVHPLEKEIEGLAVFANLAAIPEPVHAVSIITPSSVTERLVEEAAKLGIEHVWMQPGAESEAAVTRAEELGLSVISGGPCLLVALGFREVE